MVFMWALLRPPINCPECGKALPKFRIPKTIKQALWGGALWGGGVCPNCGTEIDRKGRRVSKGGLKLYCPECGEQNPDDAKFCSGCGSQLRTEHEKRLGTMTNTDDIPEALAILEGTYLVRHNEELNKRVNDALDLILAKGDIGIKVLLERLYRDMRLVGSNLQVMFGGDEAWNEWLKKRAIVEALGRARAKSAVPQLVPLVSAQRRVAQFSEILRPAVVRALGEIGDKRALEPLHNALRSDQVNQATKKATGGGKMNKLKIKKIGVKWILSTASVIFAIAGVVIGIFTFFVFPTAAAVGLDFGAKLLAWIIFVVLYTLIMTVGILVVVWLYNILSPSLGCITLNVENENIEE